MNALIAARAAEIKAVVARVLEVDEDAVGPADHFVDDLGADSMKLIELLANLEIEFDVEVDSAEFERLVSLDGVYDVLSNALDG
ncbi:acyl carrier protein [Actinophytocola gossypii]|uniref:Acyl carrier protein n=1 Tax=Actinophytocola gossypii TaxID=2812003 RepID=A0ABT2JHN0_9PSEU|nr:acyl carrier protein [Actinophytocola gossypii]MCT2587393.1 acyl carrier protein [Actinophytocola gossypii]